jgi:hypothetical protein
VVTTRRSRGCKRVERAPVMAVRHLLGADPSIGERAGLAEAQHVGVAERLVGRCNAHEGVTRGQPTGGGQFRDGSDEKAVLM